MSQAELYVAEGPHSIIAVSTLPTAPTNVQLTRNTDCENAVLFIDKRIFKLTAFINSVGEPQLRIKEIAWEEPKENADSHS